MAPSGGCCAASQTRLEPVEGIPECRPAVRSRDRTSCWATSIADAPGVIVPLPGGWHDTGDVVSIDEEGFIAIKGRMKRFAKIGGEIVSLAVVENCASALWPDHCHAADRRAGRPQGRAGRARDHKCQTPIAHDLVGWAHNHGVPEIAVPRRIVHVERVPVLGTGKTDYTKVQALLRDAADANLQPDSYEFDIAGAAMKLDRRKALSLLAAGTAAPLAASAKTLKGHTGAVAFLHGVASGDPDADSVLLWTRVTPKSANAGNIPISWEIAGDAAFRRIVSRGAIETHADRDFTAKVVAAGLRPGTEYFYRFHAGNAMSPVGRTKTLPQGPVNDAVLAFVTCALYPGGYFNAYDHIAKRERVDAVIELGDYYYEYGARESDYAMEIGRKLNRIPDPPHDIVTLADYRMRHSQYKGDPDLQAAHARAPWICVWDDHETANDSWVGGAENHDPKTEGPWITREQAALRAYYEWMPIREPESGRAFEAINRSFQFGDLATLIMVETRLVARSHQLEYDRPGDVPLMVYDASDPQNRKPVSDPGAIQQAFAAAKANQPVPAPYTIGPNVKGLHAIIDDPERQMLGARQEEWLTLEVAKSVASGLPWQIFGNQVVMARTKAPNLIQAFGRDKVEAMIMQLPEKQRARGRTFVDFFTYDIPFDLDGWDGYPAARERMYDAIKVSNANAVIVSGDSHAFWVNQLYDASGALKVAAEIGVSSVTSPSFGDYLPGVDLGKVLMDQNKEILFSDQLKKGYTLLTITREAVIAEHVAVEKLMKPYGASTLVRYRVLPADGPGIGEIEKV